jgi:DNA (cytosine-5)-methyltransferase 1
VDLFSGAGGMSLGFHRHPQFEILAAADAEIGKPSQRRGSLQCNAAYARNMGLTPHRLDLAAVAPDTLRTALGLERRKVHVLSVCPPCTGFSRANPRNHLRDDTRNSLVRRAAHFATALEADIVVMENARELIRGNFRAHGDAFRRHMEAHGYRVAGGSFMLSRFGLPQVRERALVIAVKAPLPLHTLEDLWQGRAVRPATLTVRAAFAAIPRRAPDQDRFPSFSSPLVAERLRAIPGDGGSWASLVAGAPHLLTPAMRRLVRLNKTGSHPDVYGRMAWDRPAPTIKRECAHTGNGRYAHPEHDRLCSLREMAALQGFPSDYVFASGSLANCYRHLGDAVPPLISFQLAALCAWILTGRRPDLEECLLPATHLRKKDLVRTG